MTFQYTDGPIIACSTNYQGNSAIAVIRLSGFTSLSEFQPYFKTNLSAVVPRMATYTDLVNDGEIIDSIVLTFYKGPHSYNTENILELSVHGNTFNVERILTLFEDKNLARRAFPGEFTYRALKSGKLSLSQVEGLDLLLNAQSDFALKQGQSLMNGDLHEAYVKLHDVFLKLKTATEMHFDFLEDIGEEKAHALFEEARLELTSLVEKLYQRASTDNGGLLSPEIVLVGDTNAGKSSLFNQVLGDRRAIVSAIKGTTRDFISEPVKLGGVTFRLIDTAGLRDETTDEIEKEGMKLSLSRVKKAFYKILVINPFEPFHSHKFLQDIDFDLIVFTHQDLADFEAKVAELKTVLGSIGAKSKLGSIEPLKLNTAHGSIGPEFSKQIINKYNLLLSKSPILLERHRVFINKLYLDLNKFNELAISTQDMAIISHDLNSVGQTIAELIGVIAPDEVLDHLFTNFCIGK